MGSLSRNCSKVPQRIDSSQMFLHECNSSLDVGGDLSRKQPELMAWMDFLCWISRSFEQSLTDVYHDPYYQPTNISSLNVLAVASHATSPTSSVNLARQRWDTSCAHVSTNAVQVYHSTWCKISGLCEVCFWASRIGSIAATLPLFNGYAPY